MATALHLFNGATASHTAFLDLREQTQWFAVGVKPRHEKAVARTLAAKDYDTFLPLSQSRKVYGGRVKKDTLPLFPRYVFARFDASERLPILVTPGVNRVLGDSKGPIPIDSCEIDSLRIAMQNAVEANSIPVFRQGERVRVTGGPLCGVEGIVARDGGSVSIVVTITLMQRSVQVVLEQDFLLHTEDGAQD